MTTATTATEPNVGDIWNSNWGYDETRISFYKVVRVTNFSVWLQKIGANTSNENGMYRYKTPNVEAVVGEVFRRKLHKSAPDARRVYMGAEISSYEWASPWGGEPEFDSGGSR